MPTQAASDHLVVAVGDSISSGWGMPTPGLSCWPWPARIAEAYGAPILNLAINAAGVEKMRDEGLPRLPPRAWLATLMLGANDVRGHGYLPPSYEQVATLIADRLCASADLVVVCTLPLGLRARSRRRGIEDAVRNANAISRQLASERPNAILVDVEDAFPDDARLLGFDRIHLTASAHVRIASRAVEALQARGFQPVRELPAEPPIGRLNQAVDLLGRLWFARGY